MAECNMIEKSFLNDLSTPVSQLCQLSGKPVYVFQRDNQREGCRVRERFFLYFDLEDREHSFKECDAWVGDGHGKTCCFDLFFGGQRLKRHVDHG